MTTATALFYVFSLVLLFAAFRVITARSPVYAALYLVLAFFSAACVWILLRAEFLAIALVLVYVGAVMVLFLFVVMMLDVDVGSLRAGFWRHFPVAAVVGGGRQGAEALCDQPDREEDQLEQPAGNDEEHPGSRAHVEDAEEVEGDSDRECGVAREAE